MSRSLQSKSMLVAALAACALGPVISRGSSAAEADGRYSMSPAEGGGFLRLDRETGAVSICNGKDGEWSCKPVSEKSEEMKRKIDELEGQTRAAEAQKKLEEAAPGRSESGSLLYPDGPEGDTVPPAPPGKLPIPNERDVDKLFDYVEGMVKKFKERIDRLEKEAKKEPATPL